MLEKHNQTSSALVVWSGHCRLGYLPWCRANSTPGHPGALPMIPLGGNGHLVTEDRGHLFDCISDIDAVSRWLACQKDNANTLDYYRREIERFLLWLGIERGRALSEATGEDIALFDDLLQAPERWPQWYGDAVPRDDPRWRPWSVKLSARSRLAALSTVNRCFRWLVTQGYLRRNPVDGAGLRLRPPRKGALIERYLDERLWQEVLETIEQMPRETRRQQRRYHRARWVMIALYSMLARASEFCNAKMGDIKRVRRPSGTQWWWQVRGKHRSAADDPDNVPIPPALIRELEVYRMHLGLSPLPEPDDETPMVVRTRRRAGMLQPVDRTTLWRIVKEVFALSADRIAEHNPQGAEHLREASPHWLRHTGITHFIDSGVSLKDAQSLSRHMSLKDLGTYAHSDRDRLYEQVARCR